MGRSRQTSEQAAYEAQLHLDGAAPLLDLDDEDGDLLSQVAPLIGLAESCRLLLHCLHLLHFL